jgi:hypothetical protein
MNDGLKDQIGHFDELNDGKKELNDDPNELNDDSKG